MIKLVDLLKEHSGEPKPYEYSPVGFSCQVCEYLNYNKDEGAYTCANEKYQDYMGTYFLVKEGQEGKKIKEKLTDQKDLANYCCNWFEPKSSIQEKKEKPGLWANIRAKRERGEAPAKKGSKAYKSAVKAAKEINKETD